MWEIALSDFDYDLMVQMVLDNMKLFSYLNVRNSRLNCIDGAGNQFIPKGRAWAGCVVSFDLEGPYQRRKKTAPEMRQRFLCA
jgi:hypothetical protein